MINFLISHLSDVVQLAIACGVSLTAIASIFGAITTTRNKRAIAEIHLSMNSRLSQLIDAVRKAAHVEGELAERARQEKPNTKTAHPPQETKHRDE